MESSDESTTGFIKKCEKKQRSFSNISEYTYTVEIESKVNIFEEESLQTKMNRGSLT